MLTSAPRGRSAHSHGTSTRSNSLGGVLDPLVTPLWAIIRAALLLFVVIIELVLLD